MSILTQHQIASLSFQEKVALIDDLWASLDSSEVSSALSDAYSQIIEQRLAAGETDIDELITLDRASRELRDMLEGVVRFPMHANDAA